jgi:hypothetical protein
MEIFALKNIQEVNFWEKEGSLNVMNSQAWKPKDYLLPR